MLTGGNAEKKKKNSFRQLSFCFSDEHLWIPPVSCCSSSGTQEVMTQISIYLFFKGKINALIYHKLLLSSPWFKL